MKSFVLQGDIIYTENREEFISWEDSYLVVEGGKVAGIYRELGEEHRAYPIKDYRGKLIVPGFVDLHLHAPQFPNQGLGMDRELLPWLETYTFPEESKYKDLAYADQVYSKFVKALWSVGTTRSVIFSSIHKEATKLLMDKMIEAGLGAYVGKVNMDRNSPEELTEATDVSILETEELILEYKDKSDLVKPIITPRFVPSCSKELMEGLGKLAVNYGLPVQSHLCENVSEVEWVGELHPEHRTYGDVYNAYQLFGQTNTIMAHCIYNSDDEIRLMADNSVFAAHCPYSNYNLSSGIMPVRRFLEEKVPVGLGSDIAGGNVLGIFGVMAGAIQASKMKWIESQGQLEPLSSSEAFFLGTKGGGSFFGKVGSFEEGYEFDALVIDDGDLRIGELSLEERIQKFIYTGSEKNIQVRYVKGQELGEPS